MRSITGSGVLLSRSTIILTALVLSASTVQAQTCDAPGRILLRIRPPVVDFPVPGLADFDAGYVESPVFRVQVRARGRGRAWTLCIRSEDSTMGGGKDVGDLQWQLVGTSTWTPLSVSDQFVTQDNRNRNLSLRFRVLLDFARDAPGLYQADMTWTGAR